MDAQENPAIVQAVMRHSKMGMTLYYSYSQRNVKRVAREKVVERLIPHNIAGPMAGPVGAARA